MKNALFLTSALLVTGVLTAADQDSAFQLKARFQAGFETVDQIRNGFGAGVNYQMHMGPGALNFELGFQNFTGRQFRKPVPAGFTEDNSVDSRKDSLLGLASRFSYSHKLNDTLSLQGGVGLWWLKNHHEAVASFNNGTVKGAWTTTMDKTSMTPAPFAGVTVNFDEIGALEFNVILASYKTITIDPMVSGTTMVPVYGTKTTTKPKLEVAYVFKF